MPQDAYRVVAGRCRVAPVSEGTDVLLDGVECDFVQLFITKDWLEVIFEEITLP